MANLVYVAVSTDYKSLVNRHYKNVLYNPTRQNFDMLLKKDRYEKSVNFGDSGGYMIANCDGSDDKKCKVVIGAGIQIKPDIVIIDPIDLCRKYGQLDIKYGFTLDYPFWEKEIDSENFSRKLKDSHRWAKSMFEVKERFCPRTELIIPLHFYTKEQLASYYRKMAKLAPAGYAIPACQKRDSEDVIQISYALAYLHDHGIKKVHILGNSYRVVISIMAAAQILGMFETISFDSRTYNNANFISNDYFYLNPMILKKENIVRGETMITHFLPPRLEGHIEFSPDEDFSVAKDKINLINAFAIRRYANRFAEKAGNISELKAYLPEAGFNKQEIIKAEVGIDVLNDSKTKGFGYVKRHYNWY